MAPLREAAQQALGALQKIYLAPEHDEYIRVWWPACEEAISALRAALAEPVQEPVQEPVAWMVYTQDGASAYVTDNPADIGEDQRALPLYTASPARRPLTDEMVKRMKENFSMPEMRGAFADGWLSAEAAHNITGGNDE